MYSAKVQIDIIETKKYIYRLISKKQNIDQRCLYQTNEEIKAEFSNNKENHICKTKSIIPKDDLISIIIKKSIIINKI